MSSLPLIIGTMLTPVDLRLTWEYSGNPTAFEVWMWSNHPSSNKEFNRIAITTAATYDVLGLNWTTYYSFRIRPITGSTYGSFGDPYTMFCQCGQGFVYYGPPPPGFPPAITIPPWGSVNNLWQLAIDIYDDIVSVTTPVKQMDEFWGYKVVNDEEWSFLARVSSAPLHFTDPVITRTYDGRHFYGKRNSFWSYYSGNIFKTDWLASQYIVKGICVSKSGRVIVGLIRYKGYDPVYSDGYDIEIAISDDWGRSFAAPVPVAAIGWDADIGMDSDIEGGESIFIHSADYTGDLELYYAFVYKYVPSTGIISLIYTSDTQAITPSPGSSFLTSISVKSSVIAIRYLADDGAGNYQPKIAVSINGGSTWAAKIAPGPLSDTYAYGPVCVCGTNLILFAYSGAHYSLYRSTDYGDSWTEVLSLAGYVLPWPYYSEIRAHETDVVFTSCAFTDVSEGQVGYMISHDSGITWAFVPAPTDVVVGGM